MSARATLHLVPTTATAPADTTGWLIDAVAGLIGVSPEHIDAHTDVADFDLDSTEVLLLASALEQSHVEN